MSGIAKESNRYSVDIGLGNAPIRTVNGKNFIFRSEESKRVEKNEHIILQLISTIKEEERHVLYVDDWDKKTTVLVILHLVP